MTDIELVSAQNQSYGACRKKIGRYSRLKSEMPNRTNPVILNHSLRPFRNIQIPPTDKGTSNKIRYPMLATSTTSAIVSVTIYSLIYPRVGVCDASPRLKKTKITLCIVPIRRAAYTSRLILSNVAFKTPTNICPHCTPLSERGDCGTIVTPPNVPSITPKHVAKYIIAIYPNCVRFASTCKWSNALQCRQLLPSNPLKSLSVAYLSVRVISRRI